ncbi:hypothetical protein [Burkholderia gladioli]|uniref:glycine-rich domain-containing protein n=1 Tax=Burkholderia gladioli TaxID=28095 RepID=UPI001FC84FD3|nr:hypothetical protein [Burkholderia gladioli]
MRRIETYIGQQVYEWAFSAQAQQTMVGLAKLSSAVLGTNTVVLGLACAPTSPAGMTVQIGKGEIYQLENLEATTCGTLPADTTDQILKQGIQLETYTSSAFAPPGTSGQSISYLIEAQYQDSDISLDPTTGNAPVVLQFYNADSPSTPWSGPGNTGATSNTFRDGVVAFQVKAGIPGTSGTQATPSPDTGWVGLWVITVAFGQTSITSANIAQYSGAPILPSGLLQSVQTGNLNFGTDVGPVNTLQANFPVPSTTLTDNQAFWVKVANTNTGAATFTPNPGVIAAAPIVGVSQSALTGGELAAGGRALLLWRADISSYVLITCTGSVQLGAPRFQTFTSSGNFTTPPGVTTIYRTGCAGGGGSAGSPNIPANNIVAGGGGGGAGKWWIRSPMSVTPGQVVPIVIGAGGVAGAVGGAGGNGSNTSVGSDVLPAGAGGQVGSSGAPSQAWPGQPGGNGFPNGEYGQDTSQYGPGATGGRGGSGPFGTSGAPGRGAIGGVASLLPPSASYGFGAGGSGAGGAYGPTSASGTTSGTVGAPGMPGFMLIEW